MAADDSNETSRYSIEFDDNDDADDDYEDYDDTEIQRQRMKTASSSALPATSNIAAGTTSATLKHKKKTKKPTRRRRRSSARFLRLGDTDNDDVDQGGNEGTVNSDASMAIPSSDNLGEMYQKAIRMNAENRINASNSWNLSLIDHLDRFLSIPEEPTPEQSQQQEKPRQRNNQSQFKNQLSEPHGVNFTRASCTLDASVKIYSYRVDDVHLTSYKVLANLNRTETAKKPSVSISKDDDDDSQGSGNKNGQVDSRNRSKPNSIAETVEQNVENINIHKLDSAFDIDPLFHKMSKAFDEGGAKGLLLANLGVGTHGCNVVFDSTLDEHEEKPQNTNHVPDNDNEQQSDVDIARNKMVDVTPLTNKLESLSAGQPINVLPLVPQLAALRTGYKELEEEGFVEKIAWSLRYASSPEDEEEADRSIHLEAIERSRASQADLGRSSYMGDDDESSNGYAPDDFGGDDDNDDGMIGTFLNDCDHRFSSVSFRDSFEASQPPSQAVVLLDAIASGNISGSQSNYEYFNTAALESIQGNMWAGAFHWKKIRSRKPTKALEPMSSRKRKARNEKRKLGRVLIDISNPPKNIEDLLRQPPRSKRGNDPLQLSKAAKAKHSKTENQLPLDVGIGMNQLNALFMRPESTVTVAKPTKAVGFGGVETVPWHGGEDYGGDSFGAGGNDDDDYGPSFGFPGGDDDDENDSVIQELEGVRKVDKVKVAYATSAKKVDVKRLKHDLWIEMEKTITSSQGGISEDKSLDLEEAKAGTEKESLEISTNQVSSDTLSFQEIVRDMQNTQTQAGVTLPFYFICALHLANERGLSLTSMGLEDFVVGGQVQE